MCVFVSVTKGQINYARKLEQHAYEHHLKTWYFAENNAQDVSLCLIYWFKIIAYKRPSTSHPLISYHQNVKIAKNKSLIEVQNITFYRIKFPKYKQEKQAHCW